MLLQQTKGDPSQGRKVRASVPLMNTALVFSEAHIQLPMKIILDPPVPTVAVHAVITCNSAQTIPQFPHTRWNDGILYSGHSVMPGYPCSGYTFGMICE